MDEMTKALQAEDARQAKLHELLETIREQIRLEVLPEHRPKGLFQNIQDAVYAMRGRTPLMHDAVITSRLAAQTGAPVGEPVAWTNEAELEYLRDRNWSEVPMSMWAKPIGAVDIPLYRAAPPPSTQKVREWQPIETAPKGDDSILATDARILNFTQVVFWDHDKKEYPWGTEDGIGYHKDRFTHWMPVPLAPILSTNPGEQ